MMQNQGSNESPAWKKFLNRFPLVRILVIAFICVMGIAVLLSIPKVRFSGINSGAAAANSPTSTASAHPSMQSAATGATASTDSPAQAKFSISDSKRYIIENASLTISVTSVDKTTATITQLATSAGGFVQSMNEYSNQGQSSTNMTIRVPESGFGTLLDTLKSYGTISNFSQSGEDVTEDHNNLQNQLTELQSESDAITRLYNKAQSMRDMLDIQQSLSQVNTEIENVQSQMHNLNRSVQLATIQVNLTPVRASGTTGNISFVGAFQQSIHFMGHAFLFMLNILGWLLPWGIIAILIGFTWYKWNNRQKSRETK